MKAVLPTTGALPLLFYTFLHHPEATVRTQVQEALDAWVEQSGPHYSIAEVESVLCHFTGTALEPFRLDDANRQVAVWLTRLAFSKTCRQSRVWINSTFNPEARGGLVLTSNLKYFFMERLAHARPHSGPRKAWAFHPARCPSPEQVPRPLPAQGWVGPNGYEAQVDLPTWVQQAWDGVSFGPSAFRSPELGFHSWIVQKASLIDSGVDVWTEQHRLHLALRRPEEMIRLGPRLLSPEGLLVHLRVNRTDTDRPMLVLHWRVTGETPLALRCTPKLKKTDFDQWCLTGPLNGPVLPESLQEALGDWIALPR